MASWLVFDFHSFPSNPSSTVNMQNRRTDCVTPLLKFCQGFCLCIYNQIQMPYHGLPGTGRSNPATLASFLFLQLPLTHFTLLWPPWPSLFPKTPKSSSSQGLFCPFCLQCSSPRSWHVCLFLVTNITSSCNCDLLWGAIPGYPSEVAP